MACGDQLERKRSEAEPVFLAHLVSGLAGRSGQKLLIFRHFIGTEKAELIEEGVAGRQVGKDFDHRLGQLPARSEQRLAEAGIANDLPDKGMLGQTVDIEGVAGRRAEQQVFGKRRVGVVACPVEGLDQRRLLRFVEPVVQSRPRRQHRFGQIRPFVRIDRAAQAELIQVVAQVDQTQHVDALSVQRRTAGNAGRFVVHPIRRRVGIDVPRRVRIADIAVTPRPARIRLRCRIERTVAQAILQIFAQGG